ncbi:MAG: pyruvate formate lyase family protein [Candidatus Latescibacteria bacterium]|jgi:formate C-acetyltransferase|nr:pyruvate formate lyase family protein [Candidatus Latescibacterota bacterium]
MSTAAVTDRIDRLRSEIMGRKGSFPEGANPFTRSAAIWYASLEPASRVQARASYIYQIVRLARIVVEPGWTLAGNHLATAHLGIPVPDPDSADDVRLLGELGVSPENVQDIRDAVSRWQQAARFVPGEGCSDYTEGLGHWGQGDTHTVYWARGWTENHSIRDYAKVIRIGFGGIHKQVEQAIEQADVTGPDFPEKERFWRAALTVCDAGILLGRRYSEEANRLAAEACARVPAEGARTLAEAAQSLWLSHILTCGEDGINANSLGRLDQILFPYYAADVEAGRLDRDGARDLMAELACRLYLEYDVQAITLGGVDREGRDATNELSTLILEATRDLGFVRDLSVRLHGDSPAAFVHLASELVSGGGGIPFAFNDACFIPALTQHGVSLEDARDYAPIGCVELTIPGKASPHAVSGWFSAAKCLELALFDGRDPATDQQIGPQTGRLEDFAAFGDLFDAYRRQVEYFAPRMVYHCNRGELAQRDGGPLPCWSVLTDDCIQRGRDITDGGSVYNYHSICFLGTANAADSLMAIKKLLFDEGRVSPADLLTAVRANFEDHEGLRQMLFRQAPKYGNDHAEVDGLASRIANHFIDVMDGMACSHDGRYFVHLFSFRCNIEFGKDVGALPDGRLAGEPLAYSLSAHQGRDENGVTAMLNSLSVLPHNRAAGGSAAILEVDPELVAGEAGAVRLAQLTSSAFEMGVGQLQWNVTTAERLIQAQEDPERYGNIAVRVAGYSQMFKLIPKELQDHIIARTKHRH